MTKGVPIYWGGCREVGMEGTMSGAGVAAMEGMRRAMGRTRTWAMGAVTRTTTEAAMTAAMAV